jgi:hypothetical protein
MLDEEIKNIFDDALEMTQELFHSKLRDIRTFFRPPRTTTEPPAASEPNLPEASELDAEEELNDGNLEPEGVEEAHDEEDEYDREKKPEYTEETKRLIEGNVDSSTWYLPISRSQQAS